MRINKPQDFVSPPKKRRPESVLGPRRQEARSMILVNHLRIIIAEGTPLNILLSLNRIDYADLSDEEARMLSKLLIERVQWLLNEEGHFMSKSIARIVEEARNIAETSLGGGNSRVSKHNDRFAPGFNSRFIRRYKK